LVPKVFDKIGVSVITKMT